MAAGAGPLRVLAAVLPAAGLPGTRSCSPARPGSTRTTSRPAAQAARIEAARDVCAGCPARLPCLAYALAHAPGGRGVGRADPRGASPAWPAAGPDPAAGGGGVMAAGTAYLAGARTGRRVIPGRYRPLPDLTPGEVARFYRCMLIAGHGMTWGGETNNGGYGRFPIWRGGAAHPPAGTPRVVHAGHRQGSRPAGDPPPL